jgi:hypothetical protein
MAAPIITPAGPLTKHGKDVQHFTSDQDVTWTKSGGTFSGTAARAVDWKAPNITASYTVTAENAGNETTTVTIAVTAVVPFAPDYDFEPVDDKKVLSFTPDNGPDQTRTKGPKNSFPFVRQGAQKAEYDEMRQFWNDNYPGRIILFTEPFETTQHQCQIISEFKRKGRRANLWGYSFNLKYLD